jgi:hypothetical protein
MSYRTYVEGVQIFGNNECYKKWINFIVKEGIKVDEDECYDGYISDIQGAVEVIEEIILDIAKERNDMKLCNIFDFTDIYNEEVEARNNNDYSLNLTYRLKHIMDNGYIFMSNNFIEACGDKVRSYLDFKDSRKRTEYYKLTNNDIKIHVEAY